MSKKTLRFVTIGAGFWSRYQLAGWQEAGGVECTGVYDLTRAKAEALARDFGIPHVYEDAAEMIQVEKPDFVDIVTDAGSHARYVELAAQNKVDAVCQKPMAPDLCTAESMVQCCRRAGIQLLINENWRWQTPIRAVRDVLERGDIGKVFRARVDMISGYPVFGNQPFLKQLEQFILSDLGSHTLDVARMLFGEASRLYCQTQRIHTDIRGEDVATVMLTTEGDATVLVEMAYAGNYLERERFPETFLFIEGTQGSLELAPDYWIRTTTSSGTHARRVPPPRYEWANPAYDVVHSSIVTCQANLAAALRGEVEAETSAEDNLRTMRLVFAAYESARTGQAICFESPAANDRIS